LVTFPRNSESSLELGGWRIGSAAVTVYIVGAGPGDAGLLWVRGRRLLERADAVLYDRLAGVQTIFDVINPNAEVISVGKQGGGPSWP
jgi:uroporphyrinogen III methyltransferase / synthase